MTASVINDTTIQGALNISASGTTYGITQDSSGRMLLPYQPRFDAYGAGTTCTSGSFWIFPSTQVNNGSYYNTANGRFTAPIAGTYVFYWSNIGATTDTTYRYRLYINNTIVRDVQYRVDTSETGGSYEGNGVKHYMTALSANDYVQIYFVSDNGTASYPASAATTDPYPTFSGWLLS